MAEVQLKEFMEDVLAITPRYGDLDANGIPGMGQANPGAQAVERLRQAATAFAQVYRADPSDAGAVKAKAQDVEAALQVVATMSVAPQETIEPLLDELDALVSQKNRSVTE